LKAALRKLVRALPEPFRADARAASTAGALPATEISGPIMPSARRSPDVRAAA
jgi:hypothetical protein